MSFADKIAGIMARPGADPSSAEDVPWWLKYGSRTLGTVAGFLSILAGLLNALSLISLQYSCLFAGILQMICGFVAIIFEAPCCCLFIDFVQVLSNKIDSRPYWNKAAFYMLVGIVPIFMCFGLSTLFSSGLLFGTGVLYGMMSLGKKASREEMQSSAINIESGRGLDNGHSSRGGLVPNAAPIGKSLPPQFSAH